MRTAGARRDRSAYELMAAVSRFWSRVRITDDNDGCWEYFAGGNDNGYGIYHFGSSKVYAHRFSWIATYGQLPKELVVCHRCDLNRRCVRPSHLFLGTTKVNAVDRELKREARELVTLLSARPATSEERAKRNEIIRKLVGLDYPVRFVARIFDLHLKTVQDILARYDVNDLPVAS